MALNAQQDAQATPVAQADVSTLTVAELRAQGYLVVIWTPAELGEANASHMQDIVISRGNEYIVDNKED